MMLDLLLALTLHDLAWLAGDWQTTDGARCIEERWTLPSNNMLVGMSRTSKAAVRWPSNSCA